MRPYKQKFIHEPPKRWGDCHRAALCSILEVDPQEVPHFGDGGPDGDEFTRRVRAWLERFCLVPVTVLYQGDHPTQPVQNLDDVLASASHYAPPGMHFLLGGTSRTGVAHTVVCQDGRIVHDPSQTDSGIVGPLDTGYYEVTWLVMDTRRVASWLPGRGRVPVNGDEAWRRSVDRKVLAGTVFD